MSAASAGTAGAASRLDLWLAEDQGMTRHAAQTRIAAGLVLVNGRRARAGQRVRESDTVTLVEEEQPVDVRTVSRGETAPPSKQAGLNIVYEDAYLAVVDKPAGLVVHPAPGHPTGTLADMLRTHGVTWSLLGGSERAGIVHRLDRDTSGLLVVAKTEDAHRSLAAQLRDRALGRIYTAVVHGGFREQSGTVDAPVGRDPRNRKRMAVVDGGRSAVSDFVVLERLGDMSLLEVSLRTGRTHQIRVHMAYIRHPVAGDSVYGSSEHRINRPALHASRLRLVHPDDAREMTFEAPPPDDLQVFLDALRARRR